MGDAFTSRADDASATYWNPAGMSQLSQKEILAEHALHIQDISINRLSYVHPFGAASKGGNKHANVRALGFSAAHLGMSGIEARTGNTARPDYTFGASDVYGAFSYSHPLSASASLGVTGKFIQQKLDKNRASTYAGDIGVRQEWGRFQLGATLTNVGPSVKFVKDSYPLPQALRGGASFNARPIPLNLSLEAEKMRGEADVSYRFGLVGFGSSDGIPFSPVFHAKSAEGYGPRNCVQQRNEPDHRHGRGHRSPAVWLRFGLRVHPVWRTRQRS
jgi:hypothetical protein